MVGKNYLEFYVEKHLELTSCLTGEGCYDQFLSSTKAIVKRRIEGGSHKQPDVFSTPAVEKGIVIFITSR